MPPKKRGKSPPKAKAAPKHVEPQEPEEARLQRYLLESQIDRFQTKSQHLGTKLQGVKKELEQIKGDENDVLEHMRRENATKDEIINQLQDKIHELMLDVQDKINLSDQKREQALKKFTTTQQKLEEEKEALALELKELQVFRDEKPQLEAELARLTALLEQQGEKAKQDLVSVVREYDVKEAEVRKELQAKKLESEQQLEERALKRVDAITARTVRENAVKAEEIEFLHSEINILKRENNKYSKENRDLELKLNMVDERRNQLLQRSNILQNKVELQVKRIEELERQVVQLQQKRQHDDNTVGASLAGQLAVAKNELAHQRKLVAFYEQKYAHRAASEPARWDMKSTKGSRKNILASLFPEGADHLLVQVLDEDGNPVEDRTVPYSARGRMQTTVYASYNPTEDTTVRLPPVTAGPGGSSNNVSSTLVPVPPATPRQQSAGELISAEKLNSMTSAPVVYATSHLPQGSTVQFEHSPASARH